MLFLCHLSYHLWQETRFLYHPSYHLWLTTSCSLRPGLFMTRNLPPPKSELSRDWKHFVYNQLNYHLWLETLLLCHLSFDLGQETFFLYNLSYHLWLKTVVLYKTKTGNVLFSVTWILIYDWKYFTFTWVIVYDWIHSCFITSYLVWLKNSSPRTRVVIMTENLPPV